MYKRGARGAKVPSSPSEKVRVTPFTAALPSPPLPAIGRGVGELREYHYCISDDTTCSESVELNRGGIIVLSNPARTTDCLSYCPHFGQPPARTGTATLLSSDGRRPLCLAARELPSPVLYFNYIRIDEDTSLERGI